MANFNSSFISTANIGSWDYYVFSDNVAIWRSLNGLAAWFNGSGGMLQNAALLGALILLALSLFSASTYSKSLDPVKLGTWFFFMSMMGITGQANVYNVYTNQVTVVQNIPALALVPASIFSKGAYKVFASMDTAFQGVSGSYMSVSQYGFIGPLDVLLSLRSPLTIGPTVYLNQTLSQVIHDCAEDPNKTTPPAKPLASSLDALQWFLTEGRTSSGMTTIFSDAFPSGTGTSCGSAWTYVNDNYESLANGNGMLVKMINQGTSKTNPNDPNGKWNSQSALDSFNMLIGAAAGMQQSAIQYTKNALIASTVQYSIQCMNQSGA